MGNCVTVSKNNSAQIQSPSKEKNIVRIAELGSRPQPSSMEQETGSPNLSKTENFFDSQPWLESDCEDFFSVNGDSASSCGNSPNHHKSFRESSLPEHSPTDTKKQLIEFFRESFDDEAVCNGPKSTSRSPYESNLNSAQYSEATQSAEAAQCCLPFPGLVRNMISIGERKKERKKRLSPYQN